MEDRASSHFKDKWEEELGPKAASRLTSLSAIVKDYSSFDAETKEEINDHIEVLRRAAFEATKWSYLGAGNPAAQKKLMRHELVERYGAFAIDLGLNNEFDTDLNMSP